MQADELLLAQNDERGVAQLHELAGSKDIAPEAKRATFQKRRAIADLQEEIWISPKLKLNLNQVQLQKNRLRT